MIEVTKVWWDGEKIMAEPVDTSAIYKEPEQPAPVQQCMDHGECFGGKCIYPAPQPAQHPKTKQIAECLAVLRPTVKGKFPHEQALEELVGYIAAPQPAQQEPIGKVIASVQHLRSISVELLPEVTVPPVDSMIYTSPQPAQRKPLTDEQIMAIGRELGLKCKLGGNQNIDFDYARAIEAAHNIKE